MENMMIFFCISMVISSVLIVLNSLIAKKKKNEREKPSPFECGFDPKVSSRIPFSLQFYLIAVIFLIFDVEITLIMPIPILMKTSNLVFWMWITMFFIMILLAGLYHEWNQGALQWKS